MPKRTDQFTVLMFLDRDLYGFDEHMHPPLMALMDSSEPDYSAWTHTGPTGYFLTSPAALIRIRRVIEEAEQLRSTDARFERLGIGLAQGAMVADFTDAGRLKSEMPPLGLAPQIAYRCAEADNFRDTLESIG